MKKRNIKIMLFIIIMFCLNFIQADVVEAKTYYVKGIYCNAYKYDYSLYNKYAYMYHNEIDSQRRITIQYSSSPSKILYCIEKGQNLKTGSRSYSKIATVDTNSKYGNIAKAIAYGKNGTTNVTSCTAERVATSMLVQMINKGYTVNGKLKWKTITNSGVRSIITTSNDASVASKFISIRNKVLHHDTMPFSKFSSSTKSTAQSKAQYFQYSSSNKNFYITLSDSILSESWGWKISSKDSGITSASISNGKLSVTASENTKGENLCVRIRKTVAAGNLYRSTSTNQITTALLNEDTAYKYTYICFKSSYIGVKKVDASDQNKVLSGASFRLYTDSTCKNSATDVHGTSMTKNEITNSTGYAYFYNVAVGTYYAKETQSPKNYILDDNRCRKVVVSSRAGTVNFENDEITSTSVQVFKNDKYSNSGISGVQIGLYKDEKCSEFSDLVPEEDKIKKTDDSGMVLWKNINTTGITNFPYVFYVKEINTPSGYIAETENQCKKVEINKKDITSGEVASTPKNSTIIYNIPYGNIKILKLDEETQKPIKDVTFKLLDENKKEVVVDKDGKKVESVITNENGVATFQNILYGIYYIEEVKTNKSYKVLTEPYKFELNSNTDSIKLAKLKEIPYIYGDANIDDKISNEDLTELSNLLKDENGVLGLEKKKEYSSDINSDGFIDEKDVKVLELHINNKQDISLYSSSLKILCDGKSDCTLNTNLLKNVNTIATMNNNSATENCYVPTQEETEEIEASSEQQTVNEELIATCKFTKESLEYLNQAIQDGNASNLNADFNGDNNVDETDAKILAAYLNYEQENKIGAVTNYISSVEKIGILDNDTIEIINKIGTKGAIPSEEVHASKTLVNIPIDMKISKLDVIDEKEIAGAEILIEDSNGKEFLKFTSTNVAKEFTIPAGIYTLTETQAPKGYQNLTVKIKFRVGVDGNIKLLSSNSEYYDIVASEEENDTDKDHLKIYNKQIKKEVIKVPDTGSIVPVTTAIIGFLLIATGGYFIYRKYQAK